MTNFACLELQYVSCPKCKEQKLRSDFNSNKARASGISSWCRKCNQNQSRLRSKRDPDYMSRWRKANPEAWSRWYSENKDRKKEYNSRWFSEKKEQESARFKAWREANPEKAAEIGIKRRAAIDKAIPIWRNVQEIKKIYKKAKLVTLETGVPHHVDHIVPIQSKLVCGLHWEGNLQVIPASDNFRKNNREWPGKL